MAYPAPFTQAQLEIAVGGASKLLQLADVQGTNDLASASCQAFISEVMQAAAGEIYSLLQVVFDPADPNFQAAAFVQQNALSIGVYWAWHKSTGGIAVPDDVKSARADTIASLKDAREGLRSLGSDSAVASNAGAKTVKIDPCGNRILRKNMRGFC